MRNARGAGWHRCGYRDHGMMWINVREGSYGHTRGMDASENETLTSFVKSALRKYLYLIMTQFTIPVPSQPISSRDKMFQPANGRATRLAGDKIPRGLVLRPVLQEEVCHPAACRSNIRQMPTQMTRRIQLKLLSPPSNFRSWRDDML
ncbi:hypothetical protein GGR55DRAFT_598586 [Xylaria sp. FL0064]|nr:hypothetical protein GGR55DRAFT_598586 [Xylaria sp. FL0064]